MFAWLRENRELKKLHEQPISPIVQRIVELFDTTSAWDWTRVKEDEGSYCDLSIHGPCDINIQAYSYMAEWYHVYVNGDEVTLSKRDELEIAKIVETFREVNDRLARMGNAKEERERQERISKHLAEYA